MQVLYLELDIIGGNNETSYCPDFGIFQNIILLMQGNVTAKRLQEKNLSEGIEQGYIASIIFRKKLHTKLDEFNETIKHYTKAFNITQKMAPDNS